MVYKNHCSLKPIKSLVAQAAEALSAAAPGCGLLGTHAAVACVCAATGSGSSGLSTFRVWRLQQPVPSAFGLSAPGNGYVVISVL
jgi:hypothetical protein